MSLTNSSANCSAVAELGVAVRRFLASRVKHALPILLFATLLSAAEPQPPLPAPLVLRSGPQRIVIPQRNAEGPHNFYDDACSGGIEFSVLHAVVRRGDTLYVVFTCEGWSRGRSSPRGHCGSGWERQINWMAIRGGIVLDHRQRDLASCWRDAIGSIDGWRGTKLFWTSDERDGAYTCFFDSAFPDAAIQIQEFTPRPTP